MVKRFKIEKLIRDKMLKILSDRGSVLHHKILEEDEYKKALKDKLIEEAKEVQESNSLDELIEELADSLEVIQSIAKSNGISMGQIEQVRLKKRDSKGGFDKGIYNYCIDIQDDDHEEIEYFTSRSQKYPEV